MKADIHPNVNDAKVRCNCGFEADLLTTKGKEVNVEICSKCHPFYTGKQKIVDTAGRVERFRQKYGSVQRAS